MLTQPYGLTHILFSHLRHKVYFYDATAVQLASAWCFWLTLQFVRLKLRKSFFALTKHVNAVSLKLHWTACWKKMSLTLQVCMGILQKFLSDIYSPFKHFTNGVFVVFPQLSHRRFSPVQFDWFCTQCNACFVLCVQKKTSVWFLHPCTYWGALTKHE